MNIMPLEISLFEHTETLGRSENSTRHLLSLCNAHILRKYRPGIPAVISVIV